MKTCRKSRFAGTPTMVFSTARTRRRQNWSKCKIGERFLECGLELHPEKTQIVYCRDSRRKGDYPVIQYTFLGFTFCPRQAVSKAGITFTGYLPGVSRHAMRHMRQTIRRWNVHLKNNLELANLSAMLNPILKGWMTYYTRFYGSAMAPIWNHVNHYLVRWMMRKYKTLCRHKTRASKKLQLLAQEKPQAFVHWKAGYCTSMVG